MDGLMRSLTHPVAAAWRRPACLALAVLTACFLLAGATAVRTDLAARDRALQTMLGALPPSSRTVVAGDDFDGFVGQIFGTRSPDAIEGEEIAVDLDGQTQSAYTALAGSVCGGGVSLAPEADAWTSLGTPAYYVGPYSTRFIPIRQGDPEIQFSYLQDYAQHARLISGRWPQHVKALSSGGYSIEIALSEADLNRLGLHVGSLFMARSGGSVSPPPPIAIQVTGVYQPIDPGSAYWQDQPPDVSAQWVRARNLTPYLLTGGLLGQDELGFLAAYQPFVLQSLEMTTHVPLPTATLTARQAGGYGTALEATLSQATATLQNQSQAGSNETFISPMTATLAQFEAEQQAGQLETAMPAGSLALLGLIARWVAARAAVERSSAETALQRARGAPLWRPAVAATRDAAVTIVPAALLAAAVAAVLPGQSPPWLWEYELVVPLAAVAGPTVLTALRHRHSGAAGKLARARRSPAARRFVAQAALIVLCLLGLAEVRAQGFSPAGGINLFTAAAPALAAILIALVTLNLGPPLLRLLLRAVARRRGAIGLLGLARTARSPAPAAVTVLILTVALATAELTMALHRTHGREGGAAAAAQAVYQAANYSGTSVFAAPADYGPDALEHATASYLAVLALMAVVAGCVVVALAAAVEAGERRVALARLTTMGLTAGQARAVTAVELLGPIALAAAGGTVVAAPLLWAVRPALAPALGGIDAQISAAAVALPLGAVALLAMATGLAAAAVARRGVVGTLRLGDLSEGV